MTTLRDYLLADIARTEEALAAKKAQLGTLELTAGDLIGKQMEHLRDFVRAISRHLFSNAPVLPVDAPAAPVVGAPSQAAASPVATPPAPSAAVSLDAFPPVAPASTL